MSKYCFALIVNLIIGSQTTIYGESTPQLTILIESLPANTPKNDTIYICGNFNNWEINDPDFILQRRTDGKFTIDVPFVSDTLQYKFSRGDWMKIETGTNNTYLPNRITVNKNQTVEIVTIENWQDLGGRRNVPFFVFILSAGILNGLLLIIVLFRIKKKDPTKVKHFSIWIMFLILIFVGIIGYELSNLIQKLRLFLLLQVALTVAGPLMLQFACTFKGISQKQHFKHFIIPLIILTGFTFRMFNLVPYSSFHYESNLHFPAIDYCITLGGTLLLLAYLIYILIKISNYNWQDQTFFNSFWQQLFPNTHYTTYAAKPIKQKSNNQKQFIIKLLLINVVLAFAGSLLLIYIIMTKNSLSDFLSNLIFCFTTIQIFWAFYTITFNESIFLLHKPEQTNIDHQHDYELLEKIRLVMIEQKPYINPELTLSDFSNLLNTKPHTLSKAINEYFHCSFRDFINQFRISDFINMVNQKEKSNYTYLYLAHEVGFNSKSTFNLAFKKSIGLSPRDYFKNLK